MLLKKQTKRFLIMKETLWSQVNMLGLPMNRYIRERRSGVKRSKKQKRGIPNRLLSFDLP
jgi:hypothetical protein